jgi:hypothetical protein
LARTVALADLQQSLHTLVRGESPFAMIAKSTTPNRSAILDQTGVSNSVIIVAAERTPHGDPRVRDDIYETKSLAICETTIKVYRLTGT